jgi:hypothetical protein
MPEIDEEWVRKQFQDAKVRVGTGNSVLKLLKTWSEIKATEKTAAEIIDIFSKVALNHALVEEYKGEVWAPAQPGFILVGDEVRVMYDAFSDSTGKIHNGRRGIVVAVRHGDVVIRSNDGKEPFLDGAHYSPYKLDKRVR